MGGVNTKEKLDLVNANNLTKLEPENSSSGSRRKRSLKSSQCPRGDDGLSEATPEEPTLTEEDKSYLKVTWKTLESDPTTVGIITFSQ